jgi:hypothetical protein
MATRFRRLPVISSGTDLNWAQFSRINSGSSKRRWRVSIRQRRAFLGIYWIIPVKLIQTREHFHEIQPEKRHLKAQRVCRADIAAKAGGETLAP